MLTLYPAVDIADGRAVYGAEPVAAARTFADQGAEWLHVVDLDAAFTGEPRNRHFVAAIVEATGLPVQASGGIHTFDDVRSCVEYGATRIVLGTMALTDPAFVARVLNEVGPVVAVGLDARGRTLQARGRNEEAGDLFAALDRFTAMGVPRFVYTDVARDGTLQGPNLDMLVQVADATDAAITASGGVANLDDLRALASCHEKVDAAIVGKALYAGAFTLAEALEATR